MSAHDTAVVRVATCGSVDDGKSTLVGRLLLDSNALLSDEVAHLAQASRRRGFLRTDLALVTDGLRAEREQGITIDVAWRYFSTARRRFILADTPGHAQYTRNMITGASTADVAVVLVDADRGTTDQTRRHLFIAALLAVPRVIVAVNKMDRVGFDEARHRALAGEARAIFAAGGGLGELAAVPISALRGDNVVERSRDAPWYAGPTVLELLEGSSRPSRELGPGRLPVQWVIRPQDEAFHEYRGFAGRVAEGALRVGERVVVLPSGATSAIERIEASGVDRELAVAGDSVIVHLAHDVDVGRGDLIAALDGAPALAQVIEADVCWLVGAPARPGTRLVVKHTTKKTRAIVERITHRIDVASGAVVTADELGSNDLGRLTLRLAAPIFGEPYARSRALGSLLLVDENTAETVGAAMIR